MAKQKDQSSNTPTRKQIALSRREREQVRQIYIGLGIVVGLIALVLAYGLIQSYYIEPNSTIATVDGNEIIVRDYRNRVNYERFLLQDQFAQLNQQQAALAQSSQDDQFTEMLASQFQQQANQIFQQLSIVDRQTLDIMVEDELIREEAEQRGLTVTDEDVAEYINRFLARRLGGFTAASASETATARADASATAALWTPTPTLTPSPTLTPTESITPTATPADTPTPAPTPTLNVIDTDTLSTQYQEWLNTLADSADLDEATYRNIIRAVILRDKLREAIGDEAPTSAEQTHARHILVETEEEAQDIRERIEAGEDFADLAAEVSLDTGSGAQGGDLGFVPQGRFVPTIDEAVFSLPIGELSEPIESDFGWHLVEVFEREERELLASDYAQSQRTAFTDWLSETRANADVEDFWTPELAPGE